jgi:hypothetical protein
MVDSRSLYKLYLENIVSLINILYKNIERNVKASSYNSSDITLTNDTKNTTRYILSKLTTHSELTQTNTEEYIQNLLSTNDTISPRDPPEIKNHVKIYSNIILNGLYLIDISFEGLRQYVNILDDEIKFKKMITTSFNATNDSLEGLIKKRLGRSLTGTINDIFAKMKSMKNVIHKINPNYMGYNNGIIKVGNDTFKSFFKIDDEYVHYIDRDALVKNCVSESDLQDSSWTATSSKITLNSLNIFTFVDDKIKAFSDIINNNPFLKNIYDQDPFLDILSCTDVKCNDLKLFIESLKEDEV